MTAAGEIRANVISSQGVHDLYGGVVPEIASRHHLELIGAVVDDALRRAEASLDDISLVAATRGPGLVSALLVGASTAKALAAARELPFAGVDHLHGHVAASFLAPGAVRAAVPLPDRERRVTRCSRTCATTVRATPCSARRSTMPPARRSTRAPGCSGSAIPGGAALERLARDGDPGAFAFPTAAKLPGLDFSFAGLKTALLYRVRDLGEAEAERRRADLAASYQHAIVESLVLRVKRALRATGLERLAIGGGVAANGPLRERLQLARRRDRRPAARAVHR